MAIKVDQSYMHNSCHKWAGWLNKKFEHTGYNYLKQIHTNDWIIALINRLASDKSFLLFGISISRPNYGNTINKNSPGLRWTLVYNMIYSSD